MDAWAGIALALRGPEADGLRSRVPTYLHPLAGRSLVWHVLRALLGPTSQPAQLILAAAQPLEQVVTAELQAEIVTVSPDAWWADVEQRLSPEVRQVLVVDAAATALFHSLDRLRTAPPGHKLQDPQGRVLAVWLAREEAERRVAAGALSLDELGHGLDSVEADPQEAFLVSDRARLARAGTLIRDRLVRRLMDAGVTFLLPSTVLVDVDVQIGADTVIYPGVVLEGDTTIGSETVVGPGCRIIDSWIGSGVELKGWNYVVATNVHNRAVLEPYVRRGFD